MVLFTTVQLALTPAVDSRHIAVAPYPPVFEFLMLLIILFEIVMPEVVLEKSIPVDIPVDVVERLVMVLPVTVRLEAVVADDIDIPIGAEEVVSLIAVIVLPEIVLFI